MKLNEIAGTLGLDEVELIRPVPLTDDKVGPVPPRPRDRGDMTAAADRARHRVNRRRARPGV